MSKVEYKSTDDVTAEITIDGKKVDWHDRTFESIEEEMCDHYCKMPEFYLSQYKDPDEAHEVMVNECCAKCPLERLNK